MNGILFFMVIFFTNFIDKSHFDCRTSNECIKASPCFMKVLLNVKAIHHYIWSHNWEKELNVDISSKSMVWYVWNPSYLYKWFVQSAVYVLLCFYWNFFDIRHYLLWKRYRGPEKVWRKMVTISGKLLAIQLPTLECINKERTTKNARAIERDERHPPPPLLKCSHLADDIVLFYSPNIDRKCL